VSAGARLRARAARSLASERGAAARLLLAPVAGLYGVAARARAAAYAAGLLSRRRLGRPVISVGNLTLGGTGKTPLVAALAAFLRDQGLGVAILTRGYGRRGRDREVLRSEAGELPPDAADRCGDEPALLARAVPGVAVVVDADRYAAGSWAERELDPDVFVLDDGFQHLRLARDLDIVVGDATDPFGGYALPPLGRLREPVAALRRADAVVVTRADRPFDREHLARVARGFVGADVPIFYADHRIVDLRPLPGGEPRPPETLGGCRAGILTAIGNPAVFLGDLERAGVEVVAEALHPDHHAFAQRDVDAAVALARAAGAAALVTTEKDAVKLERLDLSAFPVLSARIAFRSDAAAEIERLCLRIVRASRRDEAS
jgi:tetraacyldisaccharide 4'-kinase